MARPTRHLIQALREAAARIAATDSYQWGHMGMCNCGFLAQAITGLRADEIHSLAMERHGDWEEQADHHCETSGLLIDHILSAMMQLGLDKSDIRNLEKLSDPIVLRRLPRHVRHNVRGDVVMYMTTWADLLDLDLNHLQTEVLDDPVDLPGELPAREYVGQRFS